MYPFKNDKSLMFFFPFACTRQICYIGAQKNQQDLLKVIGGRNNNLHSPAVERLMQMQRNQIFLIPPIARQVKISGDKFHPRIQFFFATNVREGVGGQRFVCFF